MLKYKIPQIVTLTLYYLYNQNQFSSHNNYGELKMLKKKEASVSGRLSFLFG